MSVEEIAYNLFYKEGKSMRNTIIIVGTVIIVALAMIGVYSSMYTVDQGDRGIVLRYGKIVDIAEPGLNYKIPYVTSVKTITVRSNKLELKVEATTKEPQAVTQPIVINYSIDPTMLEDLYSRYGTNVEERIIIPQVFSEVRTILGTKTATEVTPNREVIAAQLTTTLTKILKSSGVMVESVVLGALKYTPIFAEAMERRTTAIMDAETATAKATAIQNEANGKAQAIRSVAAANAFEIEEMGKARAIAIEAEAKALALSPTYVEYIKFKQWNGVLPVNMYGSAPLPLLDVTNK